MGEFSPFLFILFVIFLALRLLREEVRVDNTRFNVEGSPALLTLTEASQLNRVLILRETLPELALKLAHTLEGDAWQIAHAQLCSTLWRNGQQEQALNFLSYLNKHYRAEAIEITVRELIEADQPTQAIELLKQTGDTPPQDLWLRCHLLLAENKQDEAASLLADLPQDQDNLDEAQWLQLAGLQRQLGYSDKARESLEHFWTLQHGKSPEATLYIDKLIHELVCLGDFDRLLALASTTEIQYRNPFISPLIKAGLFAEARQQIDRLPSFSQPKHHQELLDALLEQGLQAQAEELLTSLEDYESRHLLEHLADWKFEHRFFEEALHDIQRLSRDQNQSIDLYLALAERHGADHPTQSARLLKQAEKWIDAVTDQEARDELRLKTLQVRLKAELKLAEQNRSQYEIRRSLDELVTLQDRLPPWNKEHQAAQNAPLLHALGKKKEALQLLEEALHNLQKKGIGEVDADEDDLAFLQVDLAVALLQIGQPKLAIKTYESAQDADDLYISEWFETLIENDQLDYAIDQLNFSRLLTLLPTIRKLLSKLDTPAYQKHYAQLLEKMSQETFWQTGKTV